MARACQLAAEHIGEYQTTTRGLRDSFENTILETVPDTFVNGARSPRLPNTSNICFQGIDGRSLQLLLDEVGICASAGSACKSGAGTASYVLAAMGVSEEDAIGSMRFSLSSLTTEDDIDYALEQIPPVVERMRSRS
jgi:cysteine desulfurase